MRLQMRNISYFQLVEEADKAPVEESFDNTSIYSAVHFDCQSPLTQFIRAILRLEENEVAAILDNNLELVKVKFHRVRFVHTIPLENEDFFEDEDGEAFVNEVCIELCSGKALHCAAIVSAARITAALLGAGADPADTFHELYIWINKKRVQPPHQLISQKYNWPQRSPDMKILHGIPLHIAVLTDNILIVKVLTSSAVYYARLKKSLIKDAEFSVIKSTAHLMAVASFISVREQFHLSQGTALHLAVILACKDMIDIAHVRYLQKEYIKMYMLRSETAFGFFKNIIPDLYERAKDNFQNRNKNTTSTSCDNSFVRIEGGTALHLAVHLRNLEIFEALLKLSDLYELLIHAVFNRFLIIKRLLQEGHEISLEVLNNFIAGPNNIQFREFWFLLSTTVERMTKDGKHKASIKINEFALSFNLDNESAILKQVNYFLKYYRLLKTPTIVNNLKQNRDLFCDMSVMLLRLNATDADGSGVGKKTVLDYAIDNDDIEAVRYLLKLGARCSFIKGLWRLQDNDIIREAMRNTHWESYFLHSKNPCDVFKQDKELALAVLDKWVNIKFNQYLEDSCKKTNQIEYNFSFFQSELRKPQKRKSVHPILTIIKHKNIDLITHPLVQRYVGLIYPPIFFFYLLYFISYVFYAVLLTGHLFEVAHWTKKRNGNFSELKYNISVHQRSPTIWFKDFGWFSSSSMKLNTFTHCMNRSGLQETPIDQHEYSYFFNVTSILILECYSYFCLIIECLEIVVRRYDYLTFSNMIDLYVYVSTLILISVPNFNRESCQFYTDWQWQMASMTLFLQWLNVFLFFRSIPIFGVYVIMFINVLINSLKFILVFSVLIIAFAAEFHLLLGNQNRFESLHEALIRIVVMTVGELSYEEIFLDESSAAAFPYLTRTFFLLFIVIMSVVMMNLLVGLAVDDINQIQRKAQIQRLALQSEMGISIRGRMLTFYRHFKRWNSAARKHYIVFGLFGLLLCLFIPFLTLILCFGLLTMTVKFTISRENMNSRSKLVNDEGESSNDRCFGCSNFTLMMSYLLGKEDFTQFQESMAKVIRRKKTFEYYKTIREYEDSDKEIIGSLQKNLEQQTNLLKHALNLLQNIQANMNSTYTPTFSLNNLSTQSNTKHNNPQSNNCPNGNLDHKVMTPVSTSSITTITSTMSNQVAPVISTISRKPSLSQRRNSNMKLITGYSSKINDAQLTPTLKSSQMESNSPLNTAAVFAENNHVLMRLVSHVAGGKRSYSELIELQNAPSPSITSFGGAFNKPIFSTLPPSTSSRDSYPLLTPKVPLQPSFARQLSSQFSNKVAISEEEEDLYLKNPPSVETLDDYTDSSDDAKNVSRSTSALNERKRRASSNHSTNARRQSLPETRIGTPRASTLHIGLTLMRCSGIYDFYVNVQMPDLFNTFFKQILSAFLLH